MLADSLSCNKAQSGSCEPGVATTSLMDLKDRFSQCGETIMWSQPHVGPCDRERPAGVFSSETNTGAQATCPAPQERLLVRRTCSALGLSASRLGPPSVAAPRRHLCTRGSPAGSSEGCTEVGRPGRCRRTEAMEERWSVLTRFSLPGLTAAGVGPGSEELEMPLQQEWRLVSGGAVEDSGSSRGSCCGDWGTSEGADSRLHMPGHWCSSRVGSRHALLAAWQHAGSMCGR